MEKELKNTNSYLNLIVSEDQKFAFFAEYDKLGNLQKDIWRAAVWWCNRFPCACPRQSKIAEKVGCRREHVNRAFAKFKKFGWLHLTSRGFKRTKIIGIPLHLLQLNVVKREYFRRVEITPERTHSYSRLPRNTSREGPVAKKQLEVPGWLMSKASFSHDSKLRLSLLPESVYQEASFQWKKKVSQGFKADNPEKYFVGMAFKIAEKKEIKVNWGSYYASRPK